MYNMSEANLLLQNSCSHLHNFNRLNTYFKCNHLYQLFISDILIKNDLCKTTANHTIKELASKHFFIIKEKIFHYFKKIESQ